MSTNHEFTYDVKMFVTIRVKAPDRMKAAALVEDTLHAAEANFGAWPNGDPILGSASVDGELYLMEIDGEAV